MAKQVKLSAQPRAGAGSSAASKVRAAGFVPANIYSAKDPNENLQVNSRELERLLQHAVGEHILVELEIESASGKSSRLALIQEVQHEPISGKVLHVDFHAVNANEKIRSSIPVEPVGEANGVKNFGGLLEQSLREIEIECLPADLPEKLVVDVSALNVGDAIHVKDIVLPQGVAAIDDADLTVFLVAAPTVHDESARSVEAPSQPEVIKEKKEDAEKK